MSTRWETSAPTRSSASPRRSARDPSSSHPCTGSSRSADRAPRIDAVGAGVDHPVGQGQAIALIGSGGVSLFAQQLAIAVGADVHAAHRQDDKGERLVELGARDFVNMTTTADWGKIIADRSGGGAQKFINTIGATVLDEALTALAPGGEVAILGLKEIAPVPFNVTALMEGQRSLRGIAVGSRRMHRDLVDFLEQRSIHPIIDRRFAFADAPAAFRAQGDRNTFGKTVIEVS